MKQLLLLLILISGICNTYAQTNCLVFKDGAHIKACEFYNEAINHPQGSKESQELFIRSINACPIYAPSLQEISVPYLKRGDFYTWKIFIDRAVAADPQGYLGVRGWCLFKFLRDYQNAAIDLDKLYKLTNGEPGFSGDGDYDLRVVMALCEREMGNYKKSIAYFDNCISKPLGSSRVGLFDYLHRGVTKLKVKDYSSALADMQSEIRIYPKLAEAWYYLGVIQKHLQKTAEAQASFTKAKELYAKTGYHMNDPYCELLDQVYLSDIDRQLAANRHNNKPIRAKGLNGLKSTSRIY
jgi:tetratricopeptide (TPR) repeat protein